jgi:molecular chaperone DnaJ
VSESSTFKRKGDNLEVEVPLTIPEALSGADVKVPTLSGTKTLRVPPGTTSGTVQRLRGEGPPKLSGAGNGDIHYRFVIDVPDHLSEEQQKAVDELSKTFGGDPRANLFANGTGGAGGSSQQAGDAKAGSER